MYYRYYAHSLNRPSHLGIRNERYKLIFYYGHPLGFKGAYTQKTTPPAWEFYDLKNDPFELKNIYDEPNKIEIIKELKLDLKKLRSEYADSKNDNEDLLNIINEYWF